MHSNPEGGGAETWDWDSPLNFDFSNPVAIEMKFVNFLSLGG